jgi:hypothetical protein
VLVITILHGGHLDLRKSELCTTYLIQIRDMYSKHYELLVSFGAQVFLYVTWSCENFVQPAIQFPPVFFSALWKNTCIDRTTLAVVFVFLRLTVSSIKQIQINHTNMISNHSHKHVVLKINLSL